MSLALIRAAEQLREVWTDRLVTVNAEIPELKRFAGRVGRVITVNQGGRAIVDFADGAWYDLPADETKLIPLAADHPDRSKYDAERNSAQRFPGRQG